MDAVLRLCDDDVIYWFNAGGPRPRPLMIAGKPVLRDFLDAMSSVTECVCVSEHFRLIGNVGRARIEGFVRHRKTGHALVSSFRQQVTFRNRKILRIDEYHDAAKTVAFWRLIAGEPCIEPPASLPSDIRLDVAR